MRIVNSCILELREYKGRRIVCSLKFENSSDESFNAEEERDFHWLDRSDWKTVDAQLDKTVSKLENGVLEEKAFQLNDEIDVAVSISSRGVTTISKFLGHECFKKKDYTVSLNCLFQRQSERKKRILSTNICRDSQNSQLLDLNSSIIVDKRNSYCSIAESDLNLPVLEEENILSKYGGDDISNSTSKLINKGDKENSKKRLPVKVRITQDDNIDLRKYVESTSENLKKYDLQKKKLRSKRMSARREKICQVVIGEYKECFNSNDESDDFTVETPVKMGPKTQESLIKTRRVRGLKCDTLRCQESESNSKWLTEKQPEVLVASKKKSKITKSEINSRESVASKNTDCQHRQNEQIKFNKKMESYLERIIQVPKKVKILTLNNMDSDEILNTFPDYKNQLDAVFSELRSKPKVSGYNGINHYSVIELIDNEKQLKMMHKLGEVYEKDADGISKYPMLFANALMPEWLVNIFKDKYRFSYSEAVTHLNKQRQYMQYMDTDDHY